MIDSTANIVDANDLRPQLEFFEASRMSVRLENATLLDDVKSLYRITANQNRFRSLTEAMSAILGLNCQRLGFQSGIVLQTMSDQVYEVKAVHDQSADLFVGQHLPASWLELAQKHRSQAIVVGADLQGATIHSSQFAYNLPRISAYLGITLPITSVLGSESGKGWIACFVSSEPLQGTIEAEDMLFLELLAEGIACMTDLQTSRAQRKTEDLAIHASGSLKSLDEYRASAELPEGLGISGKVVDVLRKRIGQSSLSIDNIAEELNLSKRTLQRRLQQQGISFAELRDRVRFHYSIDYLVKQQVSIDRISSTLDFSDRTSFTNAFKRWTGLSPSTFRKVFRDYA